MRVLLPLLWLAACSEYRVDDGDRTPPADPPEDEIDDLGQPPDWNTCSGGWLGNYGSGPTGNMTQVRADFAKTDGTVLARLRIGNDTTIAGTDMAFRSRKGKVPPGAAQVTIVVTFAGGNNYKLAGADDLSLVLA